MRKALSLVAHIRRTPIQTYRVGEPCRCPNCARSAWHVGRAAAECAGCGYLLAVEHVGEAYPAYPAIELARD